MDELIKSLATVLRSGGSSPELNEAAAIAAWKHATGEQLKTHTRAIKLETNLLVVTVRDAIWQKQLFLMRSQLIFRVNSVLGQPLVKNLDLRVDPEGFTVGSTQPEEPSVLMDNEVPIELWSAASSISDNQLRQKFLKAALGSLRRNRK